MATLLLKEATNRHQFCWSPLGIVRSTEAWAYIDPPSHEGNITAPHFLPLGPIKEITIRQAISAS